MSDALPVPIQANGGTNMSWFQKWFGVLLIMLGELVVILAVLAFFIINRIQELSSTGPGQILGSARWVVEHANDIAIFLENLATIQVYAYGATVFGIVVLAVGFVLLVLAGRRQKQIVKPPDMQTRSKGVIAEIAPMIKAAEKPTKTVVEKAPKATPTAKSDQKSAESVVNKTGEVTTTDFNVSGGPLGYVKLTRFLTPRQQVNMSFTISGGRNDIKVYVNNPSKVTVAGSTTNHYYTNGQISFTASVRGSYSLYFDNRFSVFTSKNIQVTIN
jgi:hypothetical protein